MPLRSPDPAAVLDELGIDRAHFVGTWPDSPLTRVAIKGLEDSEHAALALVEAFERFWQVRFPEAQRARWIDNDPEALEAMWT